MGTNARWTFAARGATEAERAAHVERLLREAEAERGESLGRDAWRRLRRNRAAWWSLVFLAVVLLGSFLAPLLPIPSPIAFDLQTEPQPPVFPWQQLGNHGWQKRTALRFDVAHAEALAAVEPALGALVEEVAGHGTVPLLPAPPAGQIGYALPLRDADADLDARIAQALAAAPAPLASEVTLVACAAENEYWDLSAMDRGLLWVRAQVFGLWQTGPWLGTDSKGRDTLARIVWGSRTSILVALAAALCSLVIGVTYGSIAGYVGGRVDNWMMRFVDILYSIPFIFVVIFLITLVNEYRTELEDRIGLDREKVFYLVIGAVYWLTMARVVRGQVLSLKNMEFMEAARIVGCSTTRILVRHVMPNVLSVVIVYLTLTIPAVMLFEAFLSFLGLGIEPPKVSWGLLAVDSMEAINPLKTFWWLVVFPALAMGSTLLALNVLGDGLRDALDPKLRGKD